MTKEIREDLVYMTNDPVLATQKDIWKVIYVYMQKKAIIEPIEFMSSKECGVPIRITLN